MQTAYVNHNSLGIAWTLDPSHFIDSEILKNGCFEEHTTRFVLEFVKHDMTVVDVGANFGYFSLLFSKLVGPNGRVAAFEPVIEFRERLLRHTQVNQAHNVEILPFALGASNGTAEIQIGGDTATAHWADDNKQPRAVQKIEIRSLDNMVEEGFLNQLHFMKVDIDGGEPAFFRGASSTIKRFRPVMVVEFSQLSLMVAGSSVEDLRDQLTALGYRFHREENISEIRGLTEFRIYAHNCSHSVNIICVPT